MKKDALKIALIDNNTNLKRGSYRIHIHDLNHYFNQIGVESKINPRGTSSYDILICNKGIDTKTYPHQLKGQLTPPREEVHKSKISKLDFVLVGSADEKASLADYNDKIFIFPQIEKLYLNEKPKQHLDSNEFCIGYHGNPQHLNHLKHGLCSAMERLSKEIKLKFLVIESNLSSMRDWRHGRPDVNIEFLPWRLSSIKENIKKFDVGIVPGLSEINLKLPVDISQGKYPSDLQIRFKNKSNIGRALVLFQLGVPVIADLCPTNMHLLANPDNGYAVATEAGWYQALKELTCYKKRQAVADSAYVECHRLYNPLIWAEKLYLNIQNLYNEKR